jgi:hypothetical protein
MQVQIEHRVVVRRLVLGLAVVAAVAVPMLPPVPSAAIRPQVRSRAIEPLGRA